MKKHLLFAAALLLAACNEPSSTTTSTSAAAHARIQTPSTSIYPLKLVLRDQSGAAIGTDVFRGHPVVVSMFYGSCPAACPLIVAHVKEIEAQLPPDVRARTRVLLVSFDPERDTPEALRALAGAHRADLGRWRFAVGEDGEVRQLANALGVTYRRGEGGAISHNSVIAVLDAEGRIVARVDDPQAELDPLVAAVRMAARTEP